MNRHAWTFLLYAVAIAVACAVTAFFVLAVIQAVTGI